MFRNKKLVWQLYASYLFIILLSLVAALSYAVFILASQPRVYTDIVEGGVIVALISACISYFVAHKITRPLAELQETAIQISKGQFQYRLPLSESYEITALVNAINEMVKQLDDRIKTVEKERNEKEAILSNMIEGVIAVDLEERITSVNKAASLFLGQEPSRVIGLTIQEVIRHTDIQTFISQVLNHTDAAKEGIVIQDRFNRSLHIHGTPLTNQKGHVIAALIVLYDVTQLKNLEAIRRDFVANVSHELKTPVTLIKGFLETLTEDDEPDEADKKRFLGIMRTHADRLDAIIEDLLMLSRLEQNRESFSTLFDKVVLREVILKAIETCAHKAAEKGVQLRWSDDMQVEVEGNIQLLEQAMINLVDNAIKYGGNNTLVSITTLHCAEGVGISVTDQGMGIEEEHLSRLFERFYRVDKARSRKEGGTGLGLAIVKHIMQVHGGKVTVHSELGKGSIFTMLLPKGGWDA